MGWTSIYRSLAYPSKSVVAATTSILNEFKAATIAKKLFGQMTTAKDRRLLAADVGFGNGALIKYRKLF